MSESELNKAKHYWRNNHFQSARLVDGQPHREELARHISQLVPKHGSVLEFGCSSGRNLATLQQLRPDIDLIGIDMNEVTVQAGRVAHKDIEFVLGDERDIREFETYCDVVFTCSVLDHIPHPEWKDVYDSLVHAADRAVVLLEPVVPVVFAWTEDVLSEIDFTNTDIAATPFSYAHDYYGHDPKLRGIRRLPITNAGQWQDFGNCYWLMERKK